MVSFNGGKFNTDVYHKLTDTHQYLNFKLCHPHHVKKAIPYGQALRLKRICDLEDVYKNREKELKGFLWKRGYKKGFVEEQICRVNCLDRDVWLNGTVLYFHPALQVVQDESIYIYMYIHIHIRIHT